MIRRTIFLASLGTLLIGANLPVGPTNAARTIAAAPNLSVLTTASKAAGLTDILAGPGPFTLFAPSDAAFRRLPAGTIEALLRPESKPILAKVLGYHVVAGMLTTHNLINRIAAGDGRAVLATVEGEPLMLSLDGQALLLTDVNGNKSRFDTADLRQSNGIVHIIDGVLLPKLN